MSTHPHTTNKYQRIDIRTTAQMKATFTSAAQLAGVSVSAFLIDAAFEKAKELLRQQDMLYLADKERDRFLILLERSAKPSPKLKAAMQKYLSKAKQ